MTRFTQLSFLIILFVAACKKKETSSETTDPVLTESIARGQVVYKQYCIACHMADGLGAPPMNPSLSGTSFVKGDKNILIPIVLKGMSNQVIDGQKYHNVMPPLDFLTDEQVADVLTYVRNSFGNKASLIISDEVKTIRTK
ncbi:MAG: cytochrome c [Bacteroidota bacterium]